VLSATCAVEEGSEALIPYASQGNAAFLAMYGASRLGFLAPLPLGQACSRRAQAGRRHEGRTGFVPEHNPAAAMELFGGVAAAAAWAVSACPPPVRARPDGALSRQAF
jgi:hypothetical protein